MSKYQVVKVIKLGTKVLEETITDTFDNYKDARDWVAYLIINGKLLLDDGSLIEWDIREVK